MNTPGMTDIGYITRCHLLLNIQCVECGVWVAKEKKRFIDFDGMPHTCLGQPYGKRIVAETQELALEMPE